MKFKTLEKDVVTWKIYSYDLFPKVSVGRIEIRKKS